MEADFRQLFSRKFNCSPGDFEARMFRKCLFRHALPFAQLLRRAKDDFFREDLDLLRELATAKNTNEVIGELNRFYGRNRRDSNFLRTDLFFRVSGKRVLRLYRLLVKADEEEKPDLDFRGTEQRQAG